ncbi:MAG: vitamin K epoxide reductase family protein, partial [bacterium]
YPFMERFTLDPDDPYNQFLFEQKVPWCDINVFFSCVGVDESEYSELFGIGVAVYGFLGYVLLLLLAFRAVFLRSARMCLTRLLLFLGALFGFIFTIWLNYIEFVVIHQLCIECTISATIVLTIFILSIIATDAEVD